MLNIGWNFELTSAQRLKLNPVNGTRRSILSNLEITIIYKEYRSKKLDLI